MRILLFILIFPAISIGQSIQINYSPTSVIFWGNLPSTSKLDIGIEYKSISIEYSYINIDDGIPMSNWVGAISVIKSFNLKITPVILTYGGGLTYSLLKFPSNNGTQLNFQLRIGVFKQFDTLKIGLFYSHISNGRKHDPNKIINIGLDNIAIGITLPLSI